MTKKSKLDVKQVTPRPLWYLLEGGRPVLAAEATPSQSDQARYWTREGDPRWYPIAELLEGDRRQ
jgi:hypothetical protein